ncbi:MAG: hypothetical protein PHP52_05995 [Bacteroidales bacterium]|nr:hypothetical protein [Bacteroidales bacterium]MDD4217752.1 hypothetical protein [Bacteroidales bacterium]MDY0142171.1 hypothetical protein [Bacteroidales bacterium]
MKYEIIGILVRNPEFGAKKLQETLTLYGCIIRNRLGINRNEVKGGIIILDIEGDEKQIKLFLEELNNIEGIEYQHINL